MRHKLVTWGIRLLAFGSVAAIAVYAHGQPAQQSPRPAPVGATTPTQLLTDAQRIASLEKRIKDDEARISAHNTRIALLEQHLALLPKPPPPTTPFCASPTLSKNPQGGQRDCSPYLCDGATGTCRAGVCYSVDDCAYPPYVCDPSGHCVHVP